MPPSVLSTVSYSEHFGGYKLHRSSPPLPDLEVAGASRISLPVRRADLEKRDEPSDCSIVKVAHTKTQVDQGESTGIVFHTGIWRRSFKMPCYAGRGADSNMRAINYPVQESE
ncbi:hypothetical protein MKX08_001943 [Trichoderma sp. CBMAI-0020]|nr:hypothetical protein MKX08_001943 [Trichoderma sp. CBMAI-0020]WOD45894.1 hypothetical protein [Trichoderma atroviride]